MLEDYIDRGKDVVIVGHTPTQTLSLRDKDRAVMMTLQSKFLIGHDKTGKAIKNTQAYRVPDRNILMVDSGSFLRDSHISCVNILTGELWQS